MTLLDFKKLSYVRKNSFVQCGGVLFNGPILHGLLKTFGRGISWCANLRAGGQLHIEYRQDDNPTNAGAFTLTPQRTFDKNAEIYEITL